jgi:hypothetical protein
LVGPLSQVPAAGSTTSSLESPASWRCPRRGGRSGTDGSPRWRRDQGHPGRNPVSSWAASAGGPARHCRARPPRPRRVGYSAQRPRWVRAEQVGVPSRMSPVRWGRPRGGDQDVSDRGWLVAVTANPPKLVLDHHGSPSNVQWRFCRPAALSSAAVRLGAPATSRSYSEPNSSRSRSERLWRRYRPPPITANATTTTIRTTTITAVADTPSDRSRTSSTPSGPSSAAGTTACVSALIVPAIRDR